MPFVRPLVYVVGKLKSVAIAPAELEKAFEEGIGFDGSSIQGLTRVYEADMLARPDAATFQLLPWRGTTIRWHVVGDITKTATMSQRERIRNLLQRALESAADMGFTCYVHPEVEFYLFQQESDPEKIPSSD